MPRKINTKTQFGIVVGKKIVKTNKKIAKEDRQYFTPAELAVIDSGKMAVDDVVWSSELNTPKEVEVIDEDIDKCFLETGKPGSAERIKDIGDYYASGEEKSAFVTTDDEANQGLLMWFAGAKRGEIKIHTPLDKALFEMIQREARIVKELELS